MNQHPAYELFEELGRGANTVVFRSYDLSLGREVAIKELDENSRRDPRQREQFLREAQFLAQFEHDNVLRVYSVDTERGWIVMELMKGTLAQIIAAGPSDPDLVRSVLKQTLDALAFLHEKNKVHGTVRPTNLLINDTGRVKLSEFEQTAAGGELRAPKGSKKYLAPELIKPEFGDFGPSLDLYCLAFTALELLKGPQFETLFPGTGKGAIDADIAWLRWHSSPDDLPPTKKLVKNLPDDLAHVLDRMLKKRVADRPQSAQEVLKDLADRPLIAVPVAGVEDAGDPSGEGKHLAPGVVRTISEPQTYTPKGASPAVGVGSASMSSAAASAKTVRPAKPVKAAASAMKSAPPAFSKDWFNQQLGKPYVLYPLCAVMILAALMFSFGNPFGGPESIPVAFDVQPDAKGVQVSAGADQLKPREDGTYPLTPGPHELTLSKEGFHPVTRSFDVSPEHDKFQVKLEPIIKYVDVAITVKPTEAELKVGGTKQSLTNGAFTHKLQEGQPLKVDASLDKYVTVSRTISADELKTLANKVTIELEKEKPKLPESIVAKPGSSIDPATQWPTHILAARLGDSEPLELVLVTPGTYKFGAPDDNKRPNELAQRSVRIEQPYYIALHETTNAQYQKFAEAAGESKAGSRWQNASKKWAAVPKLDPIKNHLPVTNVSVDQAQEFCKWIGGQLPTEIEWECAIRGTDDKGFPHPWGNDAPTKDRCRIFNGEHLELGEGGPVPVEQLTAGASPLGLTHAVGNAAEWCRDSDNRDNFILRGCSIATANINDVRVTWRAKGDQKGEESSGFRVVIPVNITVAQPATTAATPKATPTSSATSASAGGGFLSSLPWGKVLDVVNSGKVAGE